MCSLGIKSLLLAVSTLLTTVSCQQPVAIPSTIVPGQPFTVYCDASRVTILDQDVTAVSDLIISQNLSMTFDIIASYASLRPQGVPLTFSKIPQGRNWNFTFSGANMGVNNTNTMNIVMSVLDTRCEDAGTYKCGVNYYLKDGTTKLVEKLQSVTAISGTSMFDLSVSPDDSNLQYNIGDNITFTCTVRGPNTLTFAWELWTNMPDYDPQPGNLPSDAIRTDWPAGSPIGTGGCMVYDMKSTLNVLISGSDYPETYKCIVSNNINNNRIELERGNITIGTEGSSPDPGEVAPQTGGSSPDVGMIVGIVLGCVALIAIIIIIIFVVRYRKRSKERNSNYKDNEDRADSAPDNNLHAPPPVFYPPSKPSKGSKDEKDSKIPTGMTNEALDNSYDSRDSGLKGPPRYINADVDTQGPPRYEKESHRGRSNRGYDDEERDRNGGHGRSHKQPREHEERKHRSRGHDDNTHHRKYNPDDGTVGHVEYGDPDMGTSI